MRSSNPVKYICLLGSILRTSDKATQFHCEQDGHDLDGSTFWYPNSQIKRTMKGSGGRLDEIDVAEWLINAKIEEYGVMP